MTDQFAPKSPYSAAGVSGLWAFGAGLRLKRPHHIVDNSYWSGTSPWIDADVQYIRTGDLNRLGLSAGIGLSAPLDDDRHWWLGPYARFTDVIDGTSFGGNAALNHTDAKIVSVGLELEFDFTGLKKPVPATPAVTPLPAPTPPVVEQEPQTREIPFVMKRQGTLDYKVRFDFDSAVIRDSDKAQLDELAADLNDPSKHPNTQVDSIEVDGHASFENHPRAEKHNQTLSEKRAAAVVAYLVSKGVKADLLTAKGFGTSVNSGLNKADDRRVEFVLSVTVTGKVVVSNTVSQ